MMPGAWPGRWRPVRGSAVLPMDAVRIQRALPRRSRYRYVQPRVEACGQGWKIVSPNCSRRIAPDGGEIDIAWFEPAAPDALHWRLYRRDHRRGRWLLQAADLTLAQALEQVTRDPLGVYWP